MVNELMQQAVESGDDMNAILLQQKIVWTVCKSTVGEPTVLSVLSVVHTERTWRSLVSSVEYLLRNGLSYFLGSRGVTLLRHVLWPEISKQGDPEENVRLDFAKRLLALGYGRREVHPAGLQILDENLEATRLEHRTRSFQIEGHTDDFQLLVKCYDTACLTLQQLARIAVRRAVGGSDFARRVRSLQTQLAPSLLEYVADPMKVPERDFSREFC